MGPGEFFQGLALGGQQFFAGTIGMWYIEYYYLSIIIHAPNQNCFAVGGVSGALGRITGALAKTTTKLTLDEEFQEERKRAGAKGIGQGLEGAAKVDLCHTNCLPKFMTFCNIGGMGRSEWSCDTANQR